MKQSRIFPLLAVWVMVFCFAACGSTDRQEAAGSSPDTSKVGPTPDVNAAANNPSLADTDYEKNRTRPITDSMKKDTAKRH
jgi:hypothetical protein